MDEIIAEQWIPEKFHFSSFSIRIDEAYIFRLFLRTAHSLAYSLGSKILSE
jgi:hypothetical protein